MSEETAEVAAEQPFPEQLQPVIATPEELLKSGEMPQIPYEKTDRVPEGWMPFLVEVVAELRLAGVECTDRTLTLVQARQWTQDKAEPDRPQVVLDRIALFGIAPDEGLEPTRWVIASQDLHAGLDSRVVEIGDVTHDEQAARAAYARTQHVLVGIHG